MDLDELGISAKEFLELIGKFWKNGIAPNSCNGNCNLVEGGGELICHGCGWTDN